VFHPGSFGIGIGALGAAFEDTGPRFGELIVAEGVATYLPTEGAHTPDYQLNYAARPPQAVLASGIVWEGLFSDLMRFSAHPDADEVPLAEIADVCVQMTGNTTTAIALVAEMQALVGASLRRSPGLPGAGLPAGARAGEVGEWLSFTPEAAYPHSTALIVGVVAREPREPILEHLRPIGGKPDLQAHLHAAIFPYMPVPQRTVMLPSLITRLFTESAPRHVLHLLHDDRGADAAGSTGLLRGVCWMARVNSVEVVA
jgi:hypothetical protein